MKDYVVTTEVKMNEAVHISNCRIHYDDCVGWTAAKMNEDVPRLKIAINGSVIYDGSILQIIALSMPI